MYNWDNSVKFNLSSECKLDTISEDILQSVANILGLKSTADLDLSSKLGDLGIDSLMGLEIVQVLERHYNIVLSMKDIKTVSILLKKPR